MGAGLSAYGARWAFNAGGFFVLDQGLERVGASQAFCRHVLPHVLAWLGDPVPAGFDPATHTTWMRILPKLVVAGILCAAVTGLARPAGRGSPVDLERAAEWAGGLLLLLSPTVHPWYALWVVPFLVTRRRAGWLYLSLILPLAYVVLLRYDGSGASWRESGLIRMAEYLPCAGLLLLGWRGSCATSSSSFSSSLP